MTDVFISYKAEEFVEANWVKTTLETNGISCWMAPMSIPGGSNYAIEIPQAIRAAKVFVLILSEKSQLSKWVPREVDQAINEGKTILPFMLENCPLRDDFNFYLSNVQRYAAYENKSVAVEGMIRQIRAILGATVETEKVNTDNVPHKKTVSEDKKTQDIDSCSSKAKHDDNSNPSKTAKTGLAKIRDKKKIGIKPLYAVIGAVAMIAVIVLISVAIVAGNAGTDDDKKFNESDSTESDFNESDSYIPSTTVKIAGKKFNKSDSYIIIKDAKLSIDDVTALSEFKRLDSIYLTDCVIPADSLDAIFKSVNYRIELINCDLTNEEFAKVDFKDVVVNAICLDGNERLTDLSGLSSLGDKLKELSFNGCSVTDVSFVAKLTSLTKLAFDSNNVEDISALKGSTALVKLSAADNSIKTLSSLLNCKKIEEISVGNNQLSDLDGLEQCIYLKRLYASNNAITNINGIQNATLLTEVNLNGNNLSDISLLSKSKGSLKKLSLSDNKIKNIDALSECSLMTELDISNNSIETLDALTDLTNLTIIRASNNRLSGITGLKNSKKLVSVDLSYNSIVNIDSLTFGESAYGISLDVSHNKISLLSVPKAKYKYLALFGNPISDLSAINETSGSTLVFNYNANINFESLGTSEYYNYFIIDCPLDKQVAISATLGSYQTHFVTEQEYLDSKE